MGSLWIVALPNLAVAPAQPCPPVEETETVDQERNAWKMECVCVPLLVPRSLVGRIPMLVNRRIVVLVLKGLCVM